MAGPGRPRRDNPVTRKIDIFLTMRELKALERIAKGRPLTEQVLAAINLSTKRLTAELDRPCDPKERWKRLPETKRRETVTSGKLYLATRDDLKIIEIRNLLSQKRGEWTSRTTTAIHRAIQIALE